MGTYFLHKDGVLVQKGTCPDGHEELHASEGFTLGLGEPDESLSWPAPPKVTYVGLRQVAYPSISDQLDALWKGGNALAEMQQQILAVKAAYPKPKEGDQQ